MKGHSNPQPTAGQLRRRRPLRRLRHPSLHDRRADPRRRRQRCRARRPEEADDAARRRRPRRTDQGHVQAHAALDHGALLGLEPAGPGRTADEDREPLGRRSALSLVERRGRILLLVQPARLRAGTEPALQSDRSSPASTSAGRPWPWTSRRNSSPPTASPSSPTRARRGLYFWGRTPTSSRGRVVIQILKGGHWRKAAVVRANAAGIFSGLARQPLWAQQTRRRAGGLRRQTVAAFLDAAGPRLRPAAVRIAVRRGRSTLSADEDRNRRARLRRAAAGRVLRRGGARGRRPRCRSGARSRR